MANNERVNAIKIFRQINDRHFDKMVSLFDAKNWHDDIEDNVGWDGITEADWIEARNDLLVHRVPA
jgi:hypothetical protein